MMELPSGEEVTLDGVVNVMNEEALFNTTSGRPYYEDGAELLLREATLLAREVCLGLQYTGRHGATTTLARLIDVAKAATAAVVASEKQRRNTIVISPQSYLDNLSACVASGHIVNTTISPAEVAECDRGIRDMAAYGETSLVTGNMSANGQRDGSNSERLFMPSLRLQDVMNHNGGVTRRRQRCKGASSDKYDIDAKLRKSKCNATVVGKWRHSISEAIVRAKENEDCCTRSRKEVKNTKRQKKAVSDSGGSRRTSSDSNATRNNNLHHITNNGQRTKRRTESMLTTLLCGSTLLAEQRRSEMTCTNQTITRHLPPHSQLTKLEKKQLKLKMRQALRTPENFCYIGDF